MGFNCGSTLSMSADAGRLAAQVAVNTTIAPSVSALVVSLFRRWQTGRWSVMETCCGLLAGLVSITAGCGNVEAGFAFLIAVIGAFVYMGASDVLKKFEIDDPVDAIPVHGACGIWGVLAAALLIGVARTISTDGVVSNVLRVRRSVVLCSRTALVSLLSWLGLVSCSVLYSSSCRSSIGCASRMKSRRLDWMRPSFHRSRRTLLTPAFQLLFHRFRRSLR